MEHTQYIPVERAIGTVFDITLFDLNFNKLKQCKSKIIAINYTEVVCEVLEWVETDKVYQGFVILSEEEISWTLPKVIEESEEFKAPPSTEPPQELPIYLL